MTTTSTITALELTELVNRWFATATDGVSDAQASTVKRLISEKMSGMAVAVRNHGDTFYETMRKPIIRSMREINAMPSIHDEDLDRVNALLDVYSAVFHNQFLNDEVVSALQAEVA